MYKEGDIFLLRSNELHYFNDILEDTIAYNINFDNRFVLIDDRLFDIKCIQIFNHSDSFTRVVDRNNPYIENIKKLILEMKDEFIDRAEGYVTMVKIQLMTIFLILMRSFGYGDTSHVLESEISYKNIIKSMDYIDEHLTERVTLEEIAAVANFSPTYFGHLFKRINGMSPWEYIISKRVALAAQLLRNHKGSMLELAYLCGFSNTSNFNKAFKKYTGSVPRRYLQLNFY